MAGIGRATIPQLRVGRGCALPSSFLPGPSSPETEQQTHATSQNPATGNKYKK